VDQLISALTQIAKNQHQLTSTNATAQQAHVINVQLVTQVVHLREIARVAAQHHHHLDISSATKVQESVTNARQVTRTVSPRMNVQTIVKILMECSNAIRISMSVCNVQKIRQKIVFLKEIARQLVVPRENTNAVPKQENAQNVMTEIQIALPSTIVRTDAKHIKNALTLNQNVFRVRQKMSQDVKKQLTAITLIARNLEIRQVSMMNSSS
jgi:hypothetical protein